MRKFLLAIIGIASIVNTQAQIKKASLLLGGRFGINSSSDKFTAPGGNTSSKYKNLIFNISAGKSFNENKFIGFTGGVLFYGLNNNNTSFLDQKTSGFNAGVFYRQYIPLGSKFYFFGESVLRYNQNNTAEKDYTGNKINSIKFNSIGLGLNPSIAYNVTKKLFLEISMPDLISAGYSSDVRKNYPTPSETKRKGYYVSTNLGDSFVQSMQFGFHFIL